MPCLRYVPRPVAFGVLALVAAAGSDMRRVVVAVFAMATVLAVAWLRERGLFGSFGQRGWRTLVFHALGTIVAAALMAVLAVGLIHTPGLGIVRTGIGLVVLAAVAAQFVRSVHELRMWRRTRRHFRAASATSPPS